LKTFHLSDTIHFVKQMRVSLNRKYAKLYQWISVFWGIFCLILMLVLVSPIFLGDKAEVIMFGNGDIYGGELIGSLVIYILSIVFGLKIDKMERSGLAKAGIILSIISIIGWFFSFLAYVPSFIGYHYF
jgi:hypothetical protein